MISISLTSGILLLTINGLVNMVSPILLELFKNKFTFKNTEEKLKNVSRISVSVEHSLFVEYFDKVLKSSKELI